MSMHLSSKKPAPASTEVKHVIEEYKHRARTVTCVCGWQGGSEGLLGGRSEWTEHVIAMKGSRG